MQCLLKVHYLLPTWGRLMPHREPPGGRMIQWSNTIFTFPPVDLFKWMWMFTSLSGSPFGALARTERGRWRRKKIRKAICSISSWNPSCSPERGFASSRDFVEWVYVSLSISLSINWQSFITYQSAPPGILRIPPSPQTGLSSFANSFCRKISQHQHGRAIHKAINHLWIRVCHSLLFRY